MAGTNRGPAPPPAAAKIAIQAAQGTVPPMAAATVRVPQARSPCTVHTIARRRNGLVNASATRPASPTFFRKKERFTEGSGRPVSNTRPVFTRNPTPAHSDTWANSDSTCMYG